MDSSTSSDTVTAARACTGCENQLLYSFISIYGVKVRTGNFKSASTSSTLQTTPHDTMAEPSQQRMMWANEAEIDEDLHEVDMNAAIGNYGQEGMYEDGE